MEFVEVVKNATYGFAQIGELVSAFVTDLLANPHVALLVEIMWGYISFLAPYIPLILLAFYLVVALFGKRLFNILRFLAFFVVGFALGIYYLSPLVLGILPTVPTWVIGVVSGVVSAVLSKLLYVVALAIVAGYSVYIICYQALIPGLGSLTGGNWIISLACAAVIVLVVFLLRQYVEMLGTAMLGGFGIATVVRGWYDYTTVSVFVGLEWLGVLLFTVIVAIVCFAVQFKHRERY
jgi:hypothetical protein